QLSEGFSRLRLRRAQSQCGDREAKPASKGQVCVPEECAKARLDRRSLARLVEHRQRQARAGNGAAFPDPVEEAQVLGEAAESDVLPVVGGRLGIALALWQRLDGAAQR